MKKKFATVYIHNTSISSQLMNGPNKLECLSPASFSSQVQYNTPAYLAHS
jgi:hypothetical protein